MNCSWRVVQAMQAWCDAFEPSPSKTAVIRARVRQHGLDGNVSVRDCIAHEDLGFASGQVNLNVSAHDVRVLVLHELGSERDLQAAVVDFFAGASHGSVRLVQCAQRAHE